VNPKKFFSEVKRRNVYKVAIAYAVVAWLLMQVASQIFTFFEIPNWAVRLVVLLLIIGSPVALILAWAFELTPEGLKRTEVADELPKKSARSCAWIYVVIVAGAISVGVFFLGRYTSSKQSAELPVKSIAVLPLVNESGDASQLGDREFRRAIELNPSLAVAHFYSGISLVRQGRLDESLEEFLKARELDPLSSIIARLGALPYYLKRDYRRALELLRQANELGPAFSSTFEIGIYIQNRLLNETFAGLEKAKQERKNDPILIYDTGMGYAAQEKRAEALQMIKELEAMSGASLSQAEWIAKIYAALNEKEMAFSWLERGLAAGAITAFYKDEPVWDPIRCDPRFADLLRRMGIPW
jgi:tetratricopeptide (TPR) repeat protein